MGDMLPAVQALFMLVRELANNAGVTETATSKWLVQRHGLAPLAATAGVSRFRDDLARSALAWTRLSAVVEPLVASIVAAGARVAPIKGVAYAKTLYASAPQRPMSDVDLLVASGGEGVAEAELARRGFSRVPGAVMHHATAWAREDLVVDVHRSILAPGRSRIDLPAIWSRMTPGWPAGAEQLDASDALAFHLLHLARNRLRGPLIHVVDAARLIDRAGKPDLALDRARDWGVGAAAQIAFRFCTSILGDRAGRPAGWLGPTHEQVAVFSQQSIASKIAFDIAVAGSPTQLASRVVHFGANRLRRLSSR